MKQIKLNNTKFVFVFFLFFVFVFLVTKNSIAAADTIHNDLYSFNSPTSDSIHNSDYLLKNHPVFTEHWSNEITFSYDDVKFEDLSEETIIPLVKYNEQFKLTWYGRMNSEYKIRWGRQHHGIDLHLKIGDTVFSAFDGVVRYAQYNHSGFGNCVVIRHLNGIETVYAHLSKIGVEPNQFVGSGQPIGLGGNTGYSKGPHLHFETRYKGYSFNPEYFIDLNTQQLKDDTLVLRKKDFTAYINKTKSYTHSVSMHQRVYHDSPSSDDMHTDENNPEEIDRKGQWPDLHSELSSMDYTNNKGHWPDLNEEVSISDVSNNTSENIPADKDLNKRDSKSDFSENNIETKKDMTSVSSKKSAPKKINKKSKKETSTSKKRIKSKKPAGKNKSSKKKSIESKEKNEGKIKKSNKQKKNNSAKTEQSKMIKSPSKIGKNKNSHKKEVKKSAGSKRSKKK